MRTIIEENKKSYRQAVDILIGLNYRTAEFINLSESSDSWYGHGDYIDNVNLNMMCKQQILMDFAGGGFFNDGNAVPISHEKIGNNTHYGIPAITVDSDIYFNATVKRFVTHRVTMFAYDSKGNIYRRNAGWSTVQTVTNITDWSLKKSNYKGFPPDERIYFGGFAIGYAYMYDNKNIVSCDISLRGMETKIDDPSLQASEIDFKIMSNEKLENIGQKSNVLYTAGYPGDMSTERIFYLNAPLQNDPNGVVSGTGYDSTAFYDKEMPLYYELVKKDNMRLKLVQILVDEMKEAIEDNYSIKNYDFFSEFEEVNDGNVSAYVFFRKGNLRDTIAEACNTWNESDFVFRYVDAGFPRAVLTSRRPSRSLYTDYSMETECNLGREIKNFGDNDISDFVITEEGSVGSVTINETEYAVSNEDVLIDNRTAGEIDSRYYVKIPSGKDFVRYYVKSSTSSGIQNEITDEVVFIDDETISVPKIFSGRQVLYGEEMIYFEGRELYEYKGGTEKYVINDLLEHRYYVNGSDQYVHTNAIERMAERSGTLYSFKYRGDPKMQPGDILTVKGIEMTVESLTLNHSEGGGFSSSVVCRGGRI